MVMCDNLAVAGKYVANLSAYHRDSIYNTTISNDIIETVSSQGFVQNKKIILGLPILEKIYYNVSRCSFNIFINQLTYHDRSDATPLVNSLQALQKTGKCFSFIP